MTRLSLAIALVLHLSGLSATAAVVCAERGMTAAACCCHHTADRSDRAPQVFPSCPCAMAPDVPAPATPRPATHLSPRTPAYALAIACLPPVDALAVQSSHPFHFIESADPSPPYLTAAHPRC